MQPWGQVCETLRTLEEPWVSGCSSTRRRYCTPTLHAKLDSRPRDAHASILNTNAGESPDQPQPNPHSHDEARSHPFDTRTTSLGSRTGDNPRASLRHRPSPGLRRGAISLTLWSLAPRTGRPGSQDPARDVATRCVRAAVGVMGWACVMTACATQLDQLREHWAKVQRGSCGGEQPL